MHLSTTPSSVPKMDISKHTCLNVPRTKNSNAEEFQLTGPDIANGVSLLMDVLIGQSYQMKQLGRFGKLNSLNPHTTES